MEPVLREPQAALSGPSVVNRLVRTDLVHRFSAASVCGGLILMLLTSLMWQRACLLSDRGIWVDLGSSWGRYPALFCAALTRCGSVERLSGQTVRSGMKDHAQGWYKCEAPTVQSLLRCQSQGVPNMRRHQLVSLS